jgi:glucose-6-phosphate isomerase
MYLECSCCEVTREKWDDLMKGSKPISYKYLKAKVKKHLPDLYYALALDYYNPFGEQSRVTKTHYILVSSAIEYFIRK